MGGDGKGGREKGGREKGEKGDIYLSVNAEFGLRDFVGGR